MVEVRNANGTTKPRRRMDIKKDDIFREAGPGEIAGPWRKAICDVYRDEVGVHLEAIEATEEDME